jgi:hypothetical protein
MSRHAPSRLHPIPCGPVVLLLPDYCNPMHEDRVVRPTRRKRGRRA